MGQHGRIEHDPNYKIHKVKRKNESSDSSDSQEAEAEGKTKEASDSDDSDDEKEEYKVENVFENKEMILKISRYINCKEVITLCKCNKFIFTIFFASHK